MKKYLLLYLIICQNLFSQNYRLKIPLLRAESNFVNSYNYNYSCTPMSNEEFIFDKDNYPSSKTQIYRLSIAPYGSFDNKKVDTRQKCFLDFFVGLKGNIKTVIVDKNRDFNFNDDEKIEFDFNQSENEEYIKSTKTLKAVFDCENKQERFFKIKPFLNSKAKSIGKLDSLEIGILSFDELLGYFVLDDIEFKINIITGGDWFINKIGQDSTIQVGINGKTYFNMAPSLKLNKNFRFNNKLIKVLEPSLNMDSVVVEISNDFNFENKTPSLDSNFENFITNTSSYRQIYSRNKNTLIILWQTHSIESINNLKFFNEIMIEFENKLSVRGILFNEQSNNLNFVLKQNLLFYKNYIVTPEYPFKILSNFKTDCFPTIIVFDKNYNLIFNECNPKFSDLKDFLSTLN